MIQSPMKVICERAAPTPTHAHAHPHSIRNYWLRAGLVFSFYRCFFVSIILCYPLAIDFNWFCTRFCHIYVVIYRRMDGQMDQWIGKQVAGGTNGWINGWTMFLSYTIVLDASENENFPTDFALFTKALQTDQSTDGPINGRIYQWTVGHILL